MEKFNISSYREEDELQAKL